MSRKTIVITGCSTGFGRYTTLTLAERGWHVFATVRKEADKASLLAEATQRNCQENVTVLFCDVTRTDEVSALAREVERLLHMETGVAESETPGLDALLNNAGSAYGGPIEIVPLDHLREQFELNVFAHVAVTQAFLPLLKVARGTIINVSSISGRISIPVTGVYSASKFALEGLSDALRVELAPFGVHVVVIEPGSSPTRIWKTSLERAMQRLSQYKDSGPYARLLQRAEKSIELASRSGFPAQKFVDLVVRILNTPRPRARYSVPATTAVILFVERFVPTRLRDRFIRRILRW